MERITRYKDEHCEGLDIKVFHSTEHETVVRLITESTYNVPLPYFYVESGSAKTDYDKEQAEYVALATLVSEKDYPKEMKWAEKVIAKWDELACDLNANECREMEFSAGNRQITIKPCFENENAEKTVANVSFYLTNDDLIQGGSDLMQIAADFVNIKQIEKINNKQKEDIYKFYKKNIFPNKDKKASELNEKQLEDFGYYSDWHKDLYGRRPNSPEKDECLKRLMKEKGNALENNR